MLTPNSDSTTRTVATVRDPAETVVVNRVNSGEESAASLNLLEIFWRRRSVILACLIVSVLAAGVYLLNATPVYRSSAQVYIEQSGPRIIGSDVGGRNIARDGLYAQTQIMRSTVLLGATMQRPAMQTVASLKSGTNPIAALRADLKVDIDPSGNLLLVNYSSAFPEDNPVIVNSVIESYLEYHNQKRRTTAAEVLKILRDEKSRLEAEFDRAMRSIIEFRRQQGTIVTQSGQNQDVTLSRLAQLSQTLTAAQLETIELKVRYEALVDAVNDPIALAELIELARLKGDPAVNRNNNARTELTIRRAEVQRLEEELGFNHRTTRQARADVRELELAYGLEEDQDPAAAYVESVRSRYDDARAREAALQREYEAQQALASEVATKSAELSMLENAAGRIDRQIDILDNRIKELNVTEDTDVMNISILEPAVGSFQVSPNRPRTIAIALVFGLMIGVGAAFLMEFTDDRVRTVDEVERITGLPVLGVIPRLRSMPGDQARTVLLEPKSSPTEAYRSLRTAIHFGISHDSGKTILVTSPMPSEGKSTRASTLASAFAQAGSRTLLIDADCRKPVQHEFWASDAKLGLSDVIVGDAQFEDVIQTTDCSSLELLPCGTVPPHPAELLNSPDFVELIEKAALEYDRVVIDSPPLGPVTDSRIITAIADATVLVAKSESTGRKSMLNACAALRSVGGKPIGIVLNDVSRRRGIRGYSYYGGHAGYGGYGQYGQDSPSPSALLNGTSDVSDQSSEDSADRLAATVDQER